MPSNLKANWVMFFRGKVLNGMGAQPMTEPEIDAMIKEFEVRRVCAVCSVGCVFGVSRVTGARQ